MKQILSFGGGVNSSAIIGLCLLGEYPMPDYIVFSDTGAEYPETYGYIKYLKEKHGLPIQILTKQHQEMTLIDYCRKMNFIPSRYHRWCTDNWKIRPLNRFGKSLNDEFTMIIGIDAGESHRAKPIRKRLYPLVDMDINREGCKQILREAKLGIPRKSGCFICPYQRKKDWINLKRDYPEKFQLAIDLEKGAQTRGQGFTYKDRPIEKFVDDLDKQKELFDFELDQSCFCELE
jgi:hypothetical protein